MQISQGSNSEKIKKYVQTFSNRVGRQNFGLIIMAISQIIWPISFIYPSEINMNPIQTSLIRSAICMISHYIILSYFDFNFDIKTTSNLHIIIKRNIIISIHQFALTGMFFILPFPVVFTINNSCALFVFIIDYYLYRVAINRQQIIGVALGFLGVLLTVNGQFFMDLMYPEIEKQTDFKNYVTDDPYLKLFAGFGFVIVNFCRAYALCITKSLKQINGIELSFHFGLMLLIMCGLSYSTLVNNQINLQIIFQCVLYCGIPQNIVQILFISAIVLSKNTGLTNIMCFISIAIGYFISLFRYNQKLNIICFGGVLLICFGIAKTIFSRQQHQK